MSKIVGSLRFSEFVCRGELRLGREPRLSLADLRGRGTLAADLRKGPLRLPFRFSFSLRREGPDLVLRPSGEGLVLALLVAFLGPEIEIGRVFRLRRGKMGLDLAMATGGRVEAIPGPSGGPDLLARSPEE
ncbi:MAG: hypothetical protein ACUVRM_01610 [Bacillota bacterium]